MKIRFKTIEHERISDAPFIGALICAIDCHIGCKGCFNQHLKQYPNQELESTEVINIVKSNVFNKGIILAGLEWSEQGEEMLELIDMALKNDLEVIVYSGLVYEVFIKKFPQLLDKHIYIKTGGYNESLRVNDNLQYGIKLASSNQKIFKGVWRLNEES